MAKKILIVDDDQTIVALTKNVLRRHGYEVAEAGSGEECLAKIKEEKPDLIFLDAVLPGMDGWEVLKTIKRDEDLRAIPVVMLTARPMGTEVLEKREIEHLADYITKPFSEEDLIACVREVLGL